MRKKRWRKYPGLKKTGVGLLGVSLALSVCVGTFKVSDSPMEQVVFQKIYSAAANQCMPVLEQTTADQRLGERLGGWITDFFPIAEYWEQSGGTVDYETQVESLLDYEEVLAREAADENYIDAATGKLVGEVEKEPEQETPVENVPETTQEETTENSDSGQTQEASATTLSGDGFVRAMTKVVEYPIEKLGDFDYLLQNFYRVDQTTTIDGSQLNAKNMLEQSMKLKSATGNPQVLIYHTHSQEAYADAVDDSGSVLGVGEHLAQILRDTYGINVLHHMGEYDVDSRDDAYTKAAVGLEQVLSENPDIEVVIDLHRDGVPDTVHLATNINGRPTAQIMFFNGLSRTTAGTISYLPNENLSTNLAFSFQMQLAAEEYYPDFSRAIYLKGYRYNMHYCPKSLLVEVGAQTNSVEEAMNAMDPLADILAKVILD